MLVYAKNPNGVLHIERVRLYGANLGYEPKDVSVQFYRKYRDLLEDATYRETDLRKRFGSFSGEVAFKYCELRYVPEKTLDRIANELGLDYDVKWDKNHKIRRVKKAIRNVSPTI